MKILRTTSLGSNYTGSHFKKCISENIERKQCHEMD